MTAREICSLLFLLHLLRYLSLALAGAVPNTTNEMIVEGVSSEPRIIRLLVRTTKCGANMYIGPTLMNLQGPVNVIALLLSLVDQTISGTECAYISSVRQESIH
jgi:hypothetical protein